MAYQPNQGSKMPLVAGVILLAILIVATNLWVNKKNRATVSSIVTGFWTVQEPAPSEVGPKSDFDREHYDAVADLILSEPSYGAADAVIIGPATDEAVAGLMVRGEIEGVRTYEEARLP